MSGGAHLRYACAGTPASHGHTPRNTSGHAADRALADRSIVSGWISSLVAAATVGEPSEEGGLDGRPVLGELAAEVLVGLGWAMVAFAVTVVQVRRARQLGIDDFAWTAAPRSMPRVC
jgi:hypothetical protein